MAEKIPSPCISICQMDSRKNICIGCYRTRQEIARWSSMDGNAQRLLLDELRNRRAEHTGVPRRQSSRQALR